MSKPTVYTSFDGDQMVFIDCMRELAIRNGLIPINPEHALGYYLSTRAHNDSKIEVMKDCLSLAMISDEFWVFTEDEDASLNTLSEGILIEILLWIRKKNTPIKFFSISKTVKSLVCNEGSIRKKYAGKDRFMKEADLKGTLNEDTFSELTGFLELYSSGLRPVIFLDIRNEDFKYVDWARRKVYENKKVPIVPQHIIPEFIYVIHGIQEYTESVNKLKDIASGIWAIYESSERHSALQKAYRDRLHATTFIPIKDLGVPKYANPRSWSITTKELRENLNNG